MREVTVINPGGWNTYYNYAANCIGRNNLPGLVYTSNMVNDNKWKLPVDCTLNIMYRAVGGSLNSCIGSFAYGAFMNSADNRVYNDNSTYSGVIQGPMTGNKVNVDTGWFCNSVIAGAFSYGISAAVDNNAVKITNIQQGCIWQVYGGSAYDTSASSNAVTIFSVDIGGNTNTDVFVADMLLMVD